MMIKNKKRYIHQHHHHYKNETVIYIYDYNIYIIKILLRRWAKKHIYYIHLLLSSLICVNEIVVDEFTQYGL
jgi:hypothetical protein